MTADMHGSSLLGGDAASVSDSQSDTRSSGDLVLKVDSLRVGYRVPNGTHWAVDGVSLTIQRGDVLGLIGESGSGKSTLGRALIGMSGMIRGDISLGVGQAHGRGRSKPTSVAMVFQNSSGSLDPRMSVWRSITEPLAVRDGLRGEARRARAAELLREVGLPTELSSRFPRQLSGGQRQRVNIARALSLEPDLVVCDEPTSALDVSAQAAVINLLKRLQLRHRASYLFISHDLAVVRALATHVAVMYLGRIVERGSVEQCIESPAHPYTKALIAAVPGPGKNFVDQSRQSVLGEVADPRDVPTGCRFRTRCPHAQPRCEVETPALRDLGSGHLAACHFAENFIPRPAGDALAAQPSSTTQNPHEQPRTHAQGESSQ